MPKYRVQLKQGKRTITSHIEAKSVDAVQNFYNDLTTMKISEILKIEFSDSSTPPIDDYNYNSLYKGFVKNNDSRKSKQILVHNLKKNKNSLDVANACKTYLELDGLMIDGLTTSLFKE